MAKQSEATLLVKIKETGSAVLDKLVFTLGDVVNAVKAVASALAAPIEAFKEQDAATNKLNQALVNSGLYSREAAKAYADMATELSKTTVYGDEAITNAQAQAQAYLGNTAVTKELTQSIMDLATAKGIDLSSAAELVGKSIGTSTNALSRQGIVVDELSTKQEKMASIITQINSKWGGQAAAAAQNLGVLDQLKNQFGEILETIGEKLAPVIETFARSLLSVANNASSVEPFINMVADAFTWLLKVSDITFTAIQNLGISLGAFLGSAAGAMTQLAQGQFKMAWETMKSGSAQADAEVEANRKASHDRLAALDQARLQKVEENAAKELQLEETSNLKKQTLADETALLKQTNEELKRQEELAGIQMHEDAKTNIELMAQVSRIDALLLNEMSATERFRLEQEKRLLLNRVSNEELKKSEAALLDFRKKQKEAELADQNAFFTAATSMSNSKNKELAAIGKAAAITQIAIKTPPAIASSFEFGTRTGGPILGAIFAGIAGIAMASQAMAIAGVPLAEGGIVRATPGGVPAIIGEGGYDEAVIPLGGPNAPSGLGGSVTINFNGPIMGDPNQAHELAIAIDKELYRLRTSGESVAFDSRLS